MSKILLINSKSPKGEDGYKTFSVRIKNHVVEKLNSMACNTGRSRNELIGIMLTFALENCDTESGDFSGSPVKRFSSE